MPNIGVYKFDPVLVDYLVLINPQRVRFSAAHRSSDSNAENAAGWHNYGA